VAGKTGYGWPSGCDADAAPPSVGAQYGSPFSSYATWYPLLHVKSFAARWAGVRFRDAAGALGPSEQAAMVSAAAASSSNFFTTTSTDYSS
jgi:hypothetical protein